MSMAMHAPGPWHIRLDNTAPPEPLRIECDARGVIAELTFTGEEEEATARLIAAAPSMHAELLELVTLMFGETANRGQKLQACAERAAELLGQINDR